MYAIAPVQTVAPTELPVSFFDAKTHLRVDHSDEDTLIAALLAAAVSHLDGWSGILGRCLMPQTWRLDLRCFEGSTICLPFPDVQGVVIEYTDPDGVTQTFPSENYYLINTTSGAKLETVSNLSWPAVYMRPDAVRVTMVCGYATVPAAIKAAILLHLGALYENRGADTDALPFAYDALIGPHRRVGI